ncbi:MAG: ABC transporter ATP-binding protein [Burkholderiales bacterium]|nr:ABC transporter ATP-binding protein [Burkholderiales bacterium]
MNEAGLAIEDFAAGYGPREVIADLGLPPLPPGTLAAVVGANAAGKSTLLKGIAGLCRARGSVRLDGTELTRLDAAERLQRVGYLPQLLPQGSALVVYEALLASLLGGGRGAVTAQAEAAVEQVLDALALRTLALRRLDELSGGQRQMVGLAQVMVRQPRLLLLDEPTSALDLRWQLRVLDTVHELTRSAGCIALVAIHDLNLALRFCSRIVVLGGGRLLAAGEPRATLDAALLQRAYGVAARVERCSLGFPVVLVDRAIESEELK